MRPTLFLFAPALLLGLAGCATATGTGTASSVNGDTRAFFTWIGDDRSGTMTANLTNGAKYSGMYLQITSEADYPGGYWGGYWGGWGPVTDYSGRVVASLDGTNGRLRCVFALARPLSGMKGGGQGQCEEPGGQTIDATFPSA